MCFVFFVLVVDYRRRCLLVTLNVVLARCACVVGVVACCCWLGVVCLCLMYVVVLLLVLLLLVVVSCYFLC